MKEHGKRPGLVLAALALAAAVVLAVVPFFGIQATSLRSIFGPAAQDASREIFFSLRVPRVCVSFLAGAALSASGMAFQALFGNPLATPFTLGVASGASLGAALYVRLGLAFQLLGLSGTSILAFAGAAVSILLVYGLTRIKGGFSTATMLLAGVAINFFFSSLILFIQYLSDFTHSFRILRWMMGQLEVWGYEPVLSMLPLMAAGVAILLSQLHELNLISLGEEIAVSRGVNLRAFKGSIFFATSMMVGGVVAVCGPIGFVGMMVPHTCRLLIGADHRALAPASLLLGGVFLTLCDTLARTVIAPAEMPVGIITALLGGPFFVWLLLRGRPFRPAGNGEGR